MRCQAVYSTLIGFLFLASADPAAACYDYKAGEVPTIRAAETNLDECSPFWKPRVMIYSDRGPSRRAAAEPVQAPAATPREPGCPTRTFDLGPRKITVFRCQG
jgi:hypothetical protein